MTGLLYGQVFIVFYLYIVDVSVQAVSCPTSRNQPVNITRVTDSTLVTWYKNNNDGITNAIYNSTTGGCLRPSINDNYTTYCEKSDNNNYRFTLQVHQPTEGDVYFTSGDSNDKTTIIFQDPVNIEPELKDKITLTNETKTQLKTSITCTPLTPVFTWIIKSQDCIKTTITGSTTTDRTGCDVNETTLTSTVTISKDTVKIINDPFTVSVQLSYKECDNIYTSQPTPYFTTKNVSSDDGVCVYDCVCGVCEDRFGVGVGVGVGVSIVIVGVIVGVTLVILKIKGRTIALPLTSTKDTGSDSGPQFTNMASSAVSGTTTSGVDEPSHYEGLNSETRENTAPTYQQLSVYQN